MIQEEPVTAPHVYRLIARVDWEAARAAGPAARLPWSADDRRDGFFHLSSHEQAAETARRHYAQVAELWVLTLDAAQLADGLEWEPSRGGALFPHYYGEAPVAAVIKAAPFDPADYG
jgi:uncharacterized protein (DUF952 family)